MLAVAFAAGAYELQFDISEPDLGGAVCFEVIDFQGGIEQRGHAVGQCDAISHANDIHVFRRSSQQLVADESPIR